MEDILVQMVKILSFFTKFETYMMMYQENKEIKNYNIFYNAITILLFINLKRNKRIKGISKIGNDIIAFLDLLEIFINNYNERNKNLDIVLTQLQFDQ
ncbi:hypothetical protein RFI_03786 [Reticulomyxa filosa]|uniref:Uncharacterized protein n=1 Tax=Reticulomyxa filosa TaxID=46433 RepID=X6P439_RETFI|nr:hypothetical protein RFI_03786 [Reticulomyxa filosa]|eukprot:ETO33320.1 hypothetical protein RFI_03786 [Reticulomyxa filosa]